MLTKDVGLVVIDESFWQCGLTFAKLAVDGLDAEPRHSRYGITMETGILMILTILQNLLRG